MRMSTRLALALLLLSLTQSRAAVVSRPDYIDCQDSGECEPGHCCVLGGNRYSVPSCRPLQGEGESCRARAHHPFNTTVGYPDGAVVDLNNVYFLFCRCAPGLHCDKMASACKARYPEHPSE